jgi:TRAP-type C4-dicarboxylate transport system permease large subunit
MTTGQRLARLARVPETLAYLRFCRLARLIQAGGIWSILSAILPASSFARYTISPIPVISWLLSYAQIPSQFASMLSPFQDNPVLILLLLSGITFITGMFMEEVSALILVTPILVPVATMAGIDPVHLGIVITLNITIALITPPMGACVFVAAAVSDLEIIEMFKSIWPFVLLAIGVLLLLILFPQITLFLPNLVG